MEETAPAPPAPVPDTGNTVDVAPPNDEKSLKRKASVDSHNDTEEGEISSPKRTRHGSDASETKYPRVEKNNEQRQVAKQEEKKRGQRLFGGLLSTLSQKPSLAQHKRRQEIEKRQQEKMHKQDAEDDVKRSQRLAKLRETRMKEQIVFEEEVMMHRHSKALRMARFLSTQSRPTIYYLPWKCTDEQEDIIDRQIRRAKEQIRREEDIFEHKRQKHINKHGEPIRKPRSIERERSSSRSRSRSRSASESRSRSRSRSRSESARRLPNPAAPTLDGSTKAMDPVEEVSKKDGEQPESQEHGPAVAEDIPAAQASTSTSAAAHEQHDEADIMEEGDEDAVIY